MTAPSTAPAQPRALETVHRRRWAILAVLVLSLLIVVLNNSPGIRHAAGESIEATRSLARELGPTGRALVERADGAFVHAMHTTVVGASAAERDGRRVQP